MWSKRSATVAQRILATVAVLAMVWVFFSPAALQSEGPDDILWMSSAVAPYPFAAQLHRDGYGWVLLTGKPAVGRQGEGGRAELKVALRRSPQLYDKLHAALRAAGVERGVTFEIGPEVLLGIAPIRLKGPEPESQARKDLIARFRNELCPASERWADGWKRILDATNAASEGRILTETGRLEVTLGPRGTPPRTSSEPEGLVSPGLLQALVEGPWRDSASRISYVVAFRAYGSHRVLVSFPERSPVLINGKELETEGPFRRKASTAPHTVTTSGQLGGRDVRFHPRQGASAHVWIYRETTLWFPADLWVERPDLEVRYALHARDIVQARLRPPDSEMRICASAASCSTIDVEDARGLAARAFGECKASLRELGKARTRGVDRTPTLFVRVGAHTCSLRFHDACLRTRRPGLDLVIEDLRAQTVQPTRFPTELPEYPTCEEAPPRNR